MTALFLDSDLFIGILVQEDRLKRAAIGFFEHHGKEELVTSSFALLEIWFKFYQQGNAADVPEALLAAVKLGGGLKVLSPSAEEMQGATLLGREFGLSPVDSIHAHLAMRYGTIVSSDGAFDRVHGLKRLDFTKESGP